MPGDRTLLDGYRVLLPATGIDPREALARELLAGFAERPKRLSSRWFYDDVGSALFTRICEQPEYYLTRCERDILRTHREAIAALCAGDGAPLDVVDLGAGDGSKTRLLLEHLLATGRPVRYVPIDISEGAVRDLTARTHDALPSLELSGLVAEYADGLAWLSAQPEPRRKLVLFLGSTIGNFHADAAQGLLRTLRGACTGGDLLLVGFDLKKDPRLLFDAYNDRAGAAAAFNFNLLERLNRELGCDFRAERFRHHASYDPRAGTIESFLVSTEVQQVRSAALQASFDFAAWEPIVIEHSHKFDLLEIEALARAVGLATELHLFDERRWFLDVLWRVPAER